MSVALKTMRSGPPSARPDDGVVDGAVGAAVQAPGRVAGAFEIDVGFAGLQALVGQHRRRGRRGNVPAPPLSSRKACSSTRNGIADLLQFDRRVAHVALADRDAGRLAVLVRTPAPAAAENIHQQEAAAVGPRAVERAAAHIALVRRRNDVRQRRRQRLEDRVDHGRQRDAPQAERGRRPGADHRAFGKHDIERRKQPSLTSRSAEVRHLKATRAAAMPPERPEFIGPAVCGFISRIIDGELRAGDAHRHLDAQRLDRDCARRCRAASRRCSCRRECVRRRRARRGRPGPRPGAMQASTVLRP